MNLPRKTISLTDFLTKKEIDLALRLYKTAAPGTFNKTIVPKIIEPNLARINAALGQENDPRYLGYMVEYVFSRVSHGGRS